MISYSLEPKSVIKLLSEDQNICCFYLQVPPNLIHILLHLSQAATLKIDKTKALKTNGSLMKVASIVECSKRTFYKWS